MLEVLFWVSFGLVAWAYLGYPAVMMTRGRLRRVPSSEPSTEPVRVTAVLAVRNGAPHLEARVANLLGQSYPPDLLDVLIVLNGCTDESPALARELAAHEPRVRVLDSPPEEGKAGALNRGVAAATGDVILLADARQEFEPEVTRRLVDAVMQPGVGMVSGRLVIGDGGATAVRGMARYWSFETKLRDAESRTGSVVGVTGAIAAVRRDVYREIPPGTILDDVYLPLRVALDGHGVGFVPEAVAHDRPSESQESEYRRRVRTLLGNVQLVQLMPELLNPRRNPLFGRFVSHKALRVVSPLLLLVMLGAALLLPGLIYRAVALAGLAGIGAGVVGLLVPVPALAVPAAFLMVQAAALEALFRRRRGAADVWTR